jgi:hypothetical protein
MSLSLFGEKWIRMSLAQQGAASTGLAAQKGG